MALTLPDPGNATTSARDSGCFTLLGEDERAAISSSIVPNLKPLLPRSMCSVYCTTPWICPATSFRAKATTTNRFSAFVMQQDLREPADPRSAARAEVVFGPAAAPSRASPAPLTHNPPPAHGVRFTSYLG